MADKITIIKALRLFVSSLLGVGIYFTPFCLSESGVIVDSILLVIFSFISALSIFFLLATANTNLGILEKESIRRKNTPKLDNKENTEFELSNLSTKNENPDSFNSVEHVKSSDVEQTSTQFNIIVSYYSIGRYINKWFGWIVLLTMCMSGLSTCLFYQKFISTVSSKFHFDSTINGTFKAVYSFYVFIYGVVLTAICQIPRLSELTWLSDLILVCLSTIACLMCVLAYLLRNFQQTNGLISIKSGLFLSVVNFVFAMNCQSVIVETFMKLRSKKTSTFFILAVATSVISCVIYAIIGIVGYNVFGKNKLQGDMLNALLEPRSDIKSYLTQNYPVMVFLPHLIGSLAIVSLTINSALQLIAVVKIIHTYLKQRCCIRENVLFFIITCACVLPICLFNFLVDISLQTILMMIGNFLCIPTAFIFPFIFSYKYLSNRKVWMKLLNIAVILIATALSSYDTISYFTMSNSFSQYASNQTLSNQTNTIAPLTNKSL